MMLKEVIDIDRTSQDVIRSLDGMKLSGKITQEEYERQYEEVIYDNMVKFEAVMLANIEQYR